MRNLLWAIPLVPLIGFLINGVVYLLAHRTKGARRTATAAGPAATRTRRRRRPTRPRTPATIRGITTSPSRASTRSSASAARSIACLLAFGAIFDVGLKAFSEGASHSMTLWRWIPLGVNQAVGQIPGGVGDWYVDVTLRVDSLSALMLLFVTFVGFLIHVYSSGYMGHEEGYGRFFAYLNLFMFSMLVLVLGGNFLMLFVGWEGVGLCSYLLIGYYYEKKFAADAGKKAFVVNRIGDFGFILGIFGVFALFGSLDFQKVFAAAAANPAAYTPYMTVLCLLLFVGACGKSAQFPLYVWLPDAMAGPTPVSALIHAATMVTAGVYMVARCNVFFRLAPHAMIVVAIVGAFTALFAATIGLVQNDIKKVLAYSTVSQLGYMFLACGVGAFTAGMFHVTTHAFFKACLFLGAGSVIHAMGGEQDIRQHGRPREEDPAHVLDVLHRHADDLRRAVSGGLLLEGRDQGGRLPRRVRGRALAAARALRRGALHGGPDGLLHVPPAVADVLGQVPGHGGAGDARPRVAGVDDGAADGARVPLDRLGLRRRADHRARRPDRRVPEARSACPSPACAEKVHHAPLSLELALMAAAVAVASIGIYLAWSWYTKGEGRAPARLAEQWPGVYRAVSNKYYVDEAYDTVFVHGLALGGGRFLWEVDATVIDLHSERRPRPSRRAPPGSLRSSTSTSSTASSTAWPARSRVSSASSAAPRPAACRTTRW